MPLGGGLGGGGPFAAGGHGGFTLFKMLGGGIGVFEGGAPFAGGRGGGGTGTEDGVTGFGGGGGGLGGSDSDSGFTGVGSFDAGMDSVSGLGFSSSSALGPNFCFFVGETMSFSSESTREGDLRTRDNGLAKTASPSPSDAEYESCGGEPGGVSGLVSPSFRSRFLLDGLWCQ